LKKKIIKLELDKEEIRSNYESIIRDLRAELDELRYKLSEIDNSTNVYKSKLKQLSED